MLVLNRRQLAMVAVLLAAVKAEPSRAEVPVNQLTAAEQRSGWSLLFDGKTTDGWRNYQKDNLSAGWAVRDAALTRVSDGADDIVTVEQFDSFELQIEYRISPGGNSGIMFHVDEEASRAPYSGPEIQIQDNVDGHDSQKSGWLYQLYKPVKPDWAIRFEQQVGFTSPDVDDATRPAGQWNHVYLRVTPQDGEVCVNGISYYYFQKGSDDWNERVAKSKFANSPLFGKAAKGHICLQDHGDEVAYRSIKIRQLPPDGIPPEPIDGRLPVKAVLAFEDIQWEAWQPVDDRGRPQELRPIQITHAGDNSKRTFVADQRGMIHLLPRDGDNKLAKLFLDLRERTHPWMVDDEEGLLGVAFHPNYSENGQLFVYYSPESAPRAVVLSRFRVHQANPNRMDPDSEEILMRIQQPFANHNGGPMAFGPDGYLYIGMGDGGGRNDPKGLGQALNSWMGCVLRIDVDRHDPGRKYAIPKDNPYVGREGALPEIYATGFRNIWRLAFDRATGDLWLADVGQDLWEEIHIVTKGSNFGWSVREGTHPFGNTPQPADVPLTEPIWEYDHRVGKSITGGHVYRGSAVPELVGHYVYGDYIAGKIWALKYDKATGRVIQNMALGWNGLPVLAFGEDEDGELYVTTKSATGQGIYRFVRNDDQ